MYDHYICMSKNYTNAKNSRKPEKLRKHFVIFECRCSLFGESIIFYRTIINKFCHIYNSFCNL